MKVKIIYERETAELGMGLDIHTYIEKKYPKCNIEILSEIKDKE